MKMKCVILAVLLFSAGVVMAADDPEGTMRPILDQLTGIIQSSEMQGAEHKVERRAKIMEEVKKGFDFREMSKRVLGRPWLGLDEKERTHFVGLMTKLLENVYIGRFEDEEKQAGKYTVKYNGERINGDRAQVSTEVSDGQQSFPIYYILSKRSGTWMVYDVNIEGVSLIRNYQEQFRSILRTDEYSGLVKAIEEKIASYEEEKK
ncbi:ABC transporter substrate-binding protein [Desulforhopalus vacuolatus]|uniref:MlaC/ttg2D family ABC transporter substrate-binding protein n=1 Tax=Desulforhopalus vacuolatus TaxID=40414 RepID=UPI001965717A|nr:ABC transporter substrate-binding protein [Desulforhopalus vacuolatus]MBM9518644.1 ABC transporter substrate-binding protein [Desulforhopalus vacuolatus]